jgi:hypothetical protein
MWDLVVSGLHENVPYHMHIFLYLLYSRCGVRSGDTVLGLTLRSADTADFARIEFIEVAIKVLYRYPCEDCGITLLRLLCRDIEFAVGETDATFVACILREYRGACRLLGGGYADEDEDDGD